MRHALVAFALTGCIVPRAPARRISAVRAVVSVVASAIVGFGSGQAIDGDWSTAAEAMTIDGALVSSVAYGLHGLGCLAWAPRAAPCDGLALTALWIGVLGLPASHAAQLYESASAPGRRHHAIVRALIAPGAGTLRPP